MLGCQTSWASVRQEATQGGRGGLEELSSTQSLRVVSSFASCKDEKSENGCCCCCCWFLHFSSVGHSMAGLRARLGVLGRLANQGCSLAVHAFHWLLVASSRESALALRVVSLGRLRGSSIVSLPLLLGLAAHTMY